MKSISKNNADDQLSKELKKTKKAVEYSLSAKLSDFKKVKITSSRDAYEYIRQFYTDDIHIFESVFILLMNRSNETIGFAKISQGGVSGTVVDVKIICKYAIDSLSCGVIMAHNHPSGNTMPSPQDKQISKKLREALMWIDITLLDSMVITDQEYYSMADDGII